jgi:hypothetical protein
MFISIDVSKIRFTHAFRHSSRICIESVTSQQRAKSKYATTKTTARTTTDVARCGGHRVECRQHRSSLTLSFRDSRINGSRRNILYTIMTHLSSSASSPSANATALYTCSKTTTFHDTHSLCYRCQRSPAMNRPSLISKQTLIRTTTVEIQRQGQDEPANDVDVECSGGPTHANRRQPTHILLSLRRYVVPRDQHSAMPCVCAQPHLDSSRRRRRRRCRSVCIVSHCHTARSCCAATIVNLRALHQTTSLFNHKKTRYLILLTDPKNPEPKKLY